MRFAIFLLLMTLVTGGEPKPFAVERVIEGYLSDAPLRVAYQYQIRGQDFEQATEGTLFVAERSVFRLDIFDKVYGSDGESVYIHDKNTHQTVIDSLKWDELHVWVRMLNGELPDDLELLSADTTTKKVFLKIAQESGAWSGILTVDRKSEAIQTMTISERSGYNHFIMLGTPEKWTTTSPSDWVMLVDLPGIRLDLR